MKLIRSWPATIPEGRSYVVDDIERFVMGGEEGVPEFDYRGLVRYDEDLVLIEWDIAVGGEQLSRFMARAAAEPHKVRVAPYLLYRGHRPDRPQHPFYCHRVREPGRRKFVTGPEDQFCHMFGFGLIYLPNALIQRFMAQIGEHGRFTDTTFSRWHMQKVHTPVPIDWDCHAIHLHYRTPEVPNGNVA